MIFSIKLYVSLRSWEWRVRMTWSLEGELVIENRRRNLIHPLVVLRLGTVRVFDNQTTIPKILLSNEHLKKGNGASYIAFPDVTPFRAHLPGWIRAPPRTLN